MSREHKWEFSRVEVGNQGKNSGQVKSMGENQESQGESKSETKRESKVQGKSGIGSMGGNPKSHMQVGWELRVPSGSWKAKQKSKASQQHGRESRV